MRTTTDTKIIQNFSALMLASRVYKRAGEYSQSHPTVAVKDNPYTRESGCEHRRALVSTKILWGCAQCHVMFPIVIGECGGHESLSGEHFGESVECDGSCNPETAQSACCQAQLFFDGPAMMIEDLLSK